MSSPQMSPLFLPIARAFGQLDDPVFVGVAVRSVAWSAASFAAIYAAAVGIVHWLLHLHGLWEWAADIFGAVGALLLAIFLFLPVATAIGTLYFDRIALAVEHRFYPWLPPPQGASIIAQTWDGVAVAGRVLALNAIALLLAILVPGIGLFLGWVIAAYAVGRGLFVAVAMRRMPRAAAESLYQSQRGVVLVNGAILAAAAYVPLINLLIPVIGTAAMVHVLDIALSAVDQPRQAPSRMRP
ncbi:EI24 domain-containing protein [Rhodopila globiformis]|nr:EI24 domain-containing protein [Rhodopila globiformis]